MPSDNHYHVPADAWDRIFGKLKKQEEEFSKGIKKIREEIEGAIINSDNKSQWRDSDKEVIKPICELCGGKGWIITDNGKCYDPCSCQIGENNEEPSEILDDRIVCPKCGRSNKNEWGGPLWVDGIIHICQDDDILYVQCSHCGHYILSLSLQAYLKKHWTCYCNSFCKCKIEEEKKKNDQNS